MTQILTLETLEAKGACTVARKKFAKIFPDGAPLKVETFVNVAGAFDWYFAAKLFLTSHNQVKFNAAMDVSRANYDTAMEVYWAGFNAEMDVACANYDAAMHTDDALCATGFITANVIYEAALSTALAPLATADAAHDTSRATGFANLYIDQESQTL